MLVELFLSSYLLLMFSELRYVSEKMNDDKLTYSLYYGNKESEISLHLQLWKQ